MAQEQESMELEVRKNNVASRRTPQSVSRDDIDSDHLRLHLLLSSLIYSTLSKMVQLAQEAFHRLHVFHLTRDPVFTGSSMQSNVDISAVYRDTTSKMM